MLYAAAAVKDCFLLLWSGLKANFVPVLGPPKEAGLCGHYPHMWAPEKAGLK